ncbi:MAG TPA: SDR family oxidoreductase [Acidimicrobiia bacterium]
MGLLESRARLDGKVALIAGGGGGLGAAIALDFAEAGMELALCDRDEGLLDRTSRAVTDAGSVPLVMVADVREPENMTKLVGDTVDRFGRLDVLVNVVAGTFRAEFLDTNSRGWDAVMRATFSWLLHTTQIAALQMRDQGTGGSIINLTSIEAHRAAPGFAVYAAMKAAVAQLSRTLALELAPAGIRVNNIAPDQVPTEGVPLDQPTPDPVSGVVYDPDGPEIQQMIRTGIPMGRRGTYEDIGSAALFLASDLSSYITGTTLHPDGGAWASGGWWNWPGSGWTMMPPPSAFDVG